jgi:hypothetical protein
LLIREVATIINYFWTEKQIQAVVKRLSHKKGWLGVKDVRSGNKAKAQEYRQLMAILVEPGRNHAFHNREHPESPNYKISFDWQGKDQLLAKLKQSKSYFPLNLLSSPSMLDLPPIEKLDGTETKYYLGRSPTDNDIKMFAKQHWRWIFIRDILKAFQDTRKFSLSPHFESYLEDKESKIVLLKISHEIACMYKAFESGWVEIKNYCPEDYTHESLFVEILRMRSYADFIDDCNLPVTGIKPSADLKRMQVITKIIPSMNSFFKGSPQIPLKDPRKTIGVDYNGGIDSVDEALRAAQSAMAKSPMQKFWTDRATKLKHILIQSSNPEIKEAALIWEEAIQDCFSNGMGLVRKIRDRRTK